MVDSSLVDSEELIACQRADGYACPVSALLYLPWFAVGRIDYPLPFPLPGMGDTLPIYPFTLLVSIGVLVAARAADAFAKRNDLMPDLVAELVVFMVLCGFFCAYLGNGILYEWSTLKEMIADPSLIRTQWLGLSSYGSFVGGVLGAVAWSALRKENLLRYGDAAAFAIPFGWFFGRVGCTLVHDHPGRVTSFPLAIADYRFGDFPYQPRHDLGLYEAVFTLIICFAFLYLWRKRRPVGWYVAALPLPYAPIRFFLDFLRVPFSEGGDNRILGLTPAQYGSVVLFALSVWLMIAVKRRDSGA